MPSSTSARRMPRARRSASRRCRTARGRPGAPRPCRAPLRRPGPARRSSAETAVPVRTTTPCSSCMRWNIAPSSGPIADASGTSPRTEHGHLVAVLPGGGRRPPGRSSRRRPPRRAGRPHGTRLRNRVDSGRRRRVCTSRSPAPGPSNRRGEDPVASSRRSYRSSSPAASGPLVLTVCAAGSMAVARTPRRTSTSWSRYQAASCGYTTLAASAPVRYPFESGGRSYGSRRSSATTTTSPSKPASRSDSAARAVVSPPPMRSTRSREAISPVFHRPGGIGDPRRMFRKVPADAQRMST